MLDDKPTDGSRGAAAEPAVDRIPARSDDSEAAHAASSSFDESIVDELAALIDDGRTYAEAELAFQKTRAAIAGKSAGLAIGYVIVAIVLLHIAFLALAVGLVMALEPQVTIWGAIAVVVGVLLFATGALLYGAVRQGKLLGALFSSGDETETESAKEA